MDRIYQEIACRTGGDVYIGVVGPVRTGKSTLIKRIMEKLVIPCMDDPYRIARARDELPQSGSGRMIMTSEPKFIPEEAVEISPDGATRLRVRMIDSVGYMVDGAVGAHEDGQPRMVTTPWFDYEIPMTEAAELGTKKVMDGHCSIGIVVTTDGSVTDIPRADYLNAERRAITDMMATGKPFLVIVNSRDPSSEQAQDVCAAICREFHIEPVAVDCQSLEAEQISQLLKCILYNFPLEQIRVFMPGWLNSLDADHPVKEGLYQKLLECASSIDTLGQAESALEALGQMEEVREYHRRSLELGTGSVDISLRFPEALFYEILSGKTGLDIRTDAQLLQTLTALSLVKQEYDKISGALSSVKATGYGVVMPEMGDMKLSAPELQKKSGSYGVRLKAGAPSIHMIRVDVDTQIDPVVGSEERSRELINAWKDAEPEQLRQSDIFGKSVYDLLQEGLTAKLIRLPDEVRQKFQGTLSRVVNEGATGLICLIL